MTMSSQDEGYRGQHDPGRDRERHAPSRDNQKSKDVEPRPKEKAAGEGKRFG